MLVEVVDVWLGGGGVGAGAPGESIVPANTETASAIVRNAVAQVRRNLFTFCASRKIQKFLHQPRAQHIFLQERERLR